MSHQESIDRGVGEDGLNSRVKEAHVYNVPVVRLIHTEVSIPARFPCLYSERTTEIPHLVIYNLIIIRSFDPLLLDPLVVIYEEWIKGSNFN